VGLSEGTEFHCTADTEHGTTYVSLRSTPYSARQGMEVVLTQTGAGFDLQGYFVPEIQ